jgi:hypothetical protein
VGRHVNILAILTTIWGALAMIIGVSMLFSAAAPIALLNAPQGEAVGFAARFMAGVFAVIGLFALLWGGAHVWVATRLKRHDPLGRLAGLGLAVVDLLILPFGTALGIYAMWVLLTNEGRRLFMYNQEQGAGRGS